MSIESIESLARSFDHELKLLESMADSSPAHLSPHHRTPSRHDGALPEHSFELAAAESERERLHDTLNDLTERVDELELHNKHQESLINHLKKRNKDLESQLLHPDFHRSDISDVAVGQEDHDELTGSSKMYRLQCKALELQLRETQLLLEQAQKSALDAAQARQNALAEQLEEVAKRVHAEKQRDAYVAAYRQALKHIEKWST